MSARGRLLALEGIDGSGKSTQARAVAEALGALLTHEPGATELGATLRTVLLGVDAPEFSARTEALLMAADRSEHVTQFIEPNLASGRWVVCDRYSGSTYAYQGYGRGVDVAELTVLVEWATQGLRPDLTILIDVPLEVASARLAEVGSPDRLERLGPGFAGRVREGFLAQAAADLDHWVLLDGTEDPASLTAHIVEVVRTRLGSP